MELYRGRPEDVSGRLEREVRSYDLLDSLGMTYWRTDHPDMPAGNMEACNEVDARTSSSATGRGPASTSCSCRGTSPSRPRSSPHR